MAVYSFLTLFSGTNAFAESASRIPPVTTAFTRTLLNDANSTEARTTLGVGDANTPTFAGLNVGDANTTLSGSAGVLSVEGKEVAFQTVIDVTDPRYGAVADGITDNQAAFAAAVAACPAGGTLLIPDGDSYYSFNNDDPATDVIDITSGITIRLEGIVQSTNGANQVDPPFIFNVTGNNFRLEGGGTLRGPGTYILNETTSANLPGLLLVNADHFTIDGITFEDPPEIAIYLPVVSGGKIVNCKFTGGPLVAAVGSLHQHYYIHGTGVDNTEISSNHFFADGSAGVAINAIDIGSNTQSDHSVITNNVFTDIHEHAIYLSSGYFDGVVSNNTVSYSQIEASQKGSAMKVGGHRNVVTGNNIYNAAKGGITCYDADDIIVTNNVISNFGQIGIEFGDNAGELEDGFNRNIVSNNILNGNSSFEVKEGILYKGKTNTDADCNDVQIIGNVLKLCGQTGYPSIYVGHTDTNDTRVMSGFNISGNTIIDPNEQGMSLVRVVRSKITDNIFRNPLVATWKAIGVDDTSDCIISGNNATDTGTNLSQLINITGSGNLDISVYDNVCVNSNDTATIGTSETYNIKGYNNRTADTLTGHLGLGEETDPDEMLHLKSSVTAKPVVKLESTVDNANAGAFDFYKLRATPTDGDVLANFRGYGYDAGSNVTNYIYERYRAVETQEGRESGSYELNVMLSGVARNLFWVDGYKSLNVGEIVFNEDGLNVDFRIESDTLTNAFSMNGSTGAIELGGAATVRGVTKMGSDTDNVSVSATGDQVFLGTGGIVFGSCYGNEIGHSVNAGSAAQNTWYEIVDANIVDGFFNLTTHDGNGAITVTEPGIYEVAYSITIEDDTSGDHVQTSVSISDTETGAITHFETFGVAKHGVLSGVGFYDCADNATIEISIRTTDAGTPDITIDHIQFTVKQVGGT